MTYLIVMFAIAAMVWAIFLAQYLNVPLNCLVVILVGVVFGHAFFNRSVGPFPLTLDRVLWGLLLVQFVVLLKMRRADPKPLSRTDLIVITLALVLTLSTFLHDWRYKENLPLARLLFFNWMPIGIYFVAKNCRLRTGQLSFLYLALAVFGLYLSVTAIAEQQGWHTLVFPRFVIDPEFVEFLGRARGPFLNPVSCGIYLAVCSAATIFMWPRANQIGRAAILIACGMSLCAAFLTFTRSVWLGAAFAPAIVIWFQTSTRVRGMLVVGGTVCLMVVVGLFSERLNSFKRDKFVTEAEMAQSASLRPMLAYVAFKMFRDRPLLGCGFGQYTHYKKPYHYSETAGMPLRKVLPYMQHNVFLSYLTETGLLGVGILLALLASLGIKGWQLWNSHERPLAERQLGLLAMIVMANYFLNGMFHDVSIIPHIGALLFLVLGLVENVSARPWRTDIPQVESGEPQALQAA